MKQLLLPLPRTAPVVRAALEIDHPDVRDLMERSSLVRAPWRESPWLLPGEEIIESELLCGPRTNMDMPNDDV